jgi:HTH-type transcriptional regulator/antitoxin HigA
MSTKTTQTLKGRVRDSYLELVRSFPLVSIRTESQLRAAQQVIDKLLAKGKPGSGEVAYLDALSDLVATYEDEHYELPPASDADMLRHLLEAKGVTQAELCRATGIAQSIISEVLSGKRAFSKDVVGKLSRYFNVDKSVLVANF